ncbi:MAG: hypothetical protein RHS_0295 [Robinsoniella sp. RHS]|nr:MAG: hypothetical protein RHS_0295 [Robinsoniella sp. RHS]
MRNIIYSIILYSGLYYIKKIIIYVDKVYYTTYNIVKQKVLDLLFEQNERRR